MQQPLKVNDANRGPVRRLKRSDAGLFNDKQEVNFATGDMRALQDSDTCKPTVSQSISGVTRLSKLASPSCQRVRSLREVEAGLRMIGNDRRMPSYKARITLPLIDASTPGPGTYELKSCMSTSGLKFGKESRVTAYVSPGPGPGKYNPPSILMDLRHAIHIKSRLAPSIRNT